MAVKMRVSGGECRASGAGKASWGVTHRCRGGLTTTPTNAKPAFVGDPGHAAANAARFRNVSFQRCEREIPSPELHRDYEGFHSELEARHGRLRLTGAMRNSSITQSQIPQLRDARLFVGSVDIAQGVADLADGGVGPHAIDDERHGVRVGDGAVFLDDGFLRRSFLQSFQATL